MLTNQQYHFYETFGYVLLPGLFTSEEMRSIIAAGDARWAAAPVEGDGKSRYQHVVPFIERDRALDWLADDDRIHGPMTQLLGAGFIWGGPEGNAGSFNETNNHTWHCDKCNDDLPYRRIKIMIYLEPMTRETGALRVIPGSHLPDFRRGLLPLNRPHVTETEDGDLGHYGVRGEDLPCAALETMPGDVVVFDQYLYHAVYHKKAGRRYIAMKFAAKPETVEQFAALDRHSQGLSSLDDAFRHATRPRIAAMVKPLLRGPAEAH